MQILKNKVTKAEHPITGSLGVPREIDENTFEVWTHFSVDLGEGRVDTIEVHPESTEWEVIDVPDPVIEPEPVVEPEPLPPPVAPEPTPEELEAQQAMQARMEWHNKKHALSTMIDDMKRAEALGIEATAEQKAVMLGLAQWINENMKQEYYF